LTETEAVPSFSQLDETPADIQAKMLDYLDRVAALRGIQRVREIARTEMGIRAGQHLLDAGCGAGEEARVLARLASPGGQVTATDLSSAVVAAAAQRDDGAGVRYVVGDITELDFPDATFDSVRSERVLQHVAQPDAAVAELARVTVPGGRVCLIDTDWESFLVDGMPDDILGGLLRLGREKGLFRPSGHQLRGRLVHAGLKEVTAEPVSIPVTDRATAETLIPLFDPEALHLGRVPTELADPWLIAFEAALARGDFLAVLTIWVATGTRN
jgi:ubiquinone/menaquinone biosynthesis C-methylase UbiE